MIGAKAEADTIYYNDEKLQEYVNLLNGLNEARTPNEWKTIKARSNFKDLFGVSIKPGDYYFTRRFGVLASNDKVLLSRMSMEKMIYCLFNRNYNMAQKLSILKQQRDREFLKAHLKSNCIGV